MSASPRRREPANPVATGAGAEQIRSFSDTDKTSKYEVIIIGAGVAGLSAAYRILTKRPGTKLLMLEARERVGGRVHSVDVGNGSVDLGASFIHGVNGNPIMELSKKLGFEVTPSRMSMRAFMPDGSLVPQEDIIRVGPRIFGTVFEWLPEISQGASTEKDIPSDVESLADRVFSKDSPIYADTSEDANTEKKDEVFIAESTIRNFQGWTGAPLDYVSLKWWGFNKDTEGGDGLLVKGYGPLIQWMKEEIERLGAVIRLGEVVEMISTDEESGVVVQSRHDNDTTRYEADYSVITLPLGVLKHDPPTFDPPLPIRRQQSIQRLGSGLLDKIVLIYDKPWWSAEELKAGQSPAPAADEDEDDEMGDPMINLLLPSKDNPTRLMGPSGGAPPNHKPNLHPGAFPPRSAEYLQQNPNALMIFDVHAQNGVSALSIFVAGEWGDVMECCSEEETRAWAESVVKDYFKELVSGEVPSPSKVLRTTWREDKFAYGSYSYIPAGSTANKNLGPASPVDQLEVSRTLWGRLYWAGEHTELNQYASVHGAWSSGVREGDKVLVQLENRE
ncbi:related to anon-37cs protein [Serendipita indica DSM 11827]|uniref:Related to anon-37cs protein n=1 Tax=Serendipita indica (strain DSM 11827) TaxID=1109443 RepID=G4TP22_SERID|nr:related to anon-37cs protein [Serendipita indica DSM 11827]